MTYKKISMLCTYHLEYVQKLIFQKIAETIWKYLSGNFVPRWIFFMWLPCIGMMKLLKKIKECDIILYNDKCT